jgi:hypothetical protein
MPLTPLQTTIMRLLIAQRSAKSYVAGATALHFRPIGLRFSDDIDFFHGAQERVAAAFRRDSKALLAAGYEVEVTISGDHMIRAIVRSDDKQTRLDWSHDSAWRFMPLVACDTLGWRLHDIDLAINKLLALAGRDELRDLLDILYCDEKILGLGALCWAAGGKDPGLTPLFILAALRAKGRITHHELDALALVEPTDPPTIKRSWLAALGAAERFIAERPPDEMGCLYFDPSSQRFVQPTKGDEVSPHYGRPGGILPQPTRSH